MQATGNQEKGDNPREPCDAIFGKRHAKRENNCKQQERLPKVAHGILHVHLSRSGNVLEVGNEAGGR